MSEIKSILYDKDERPTDDANVAVRGEVVEIDDQGAILARFRSGGLTWKVDPKSLDGDEGELATRPTKATPPLVGDAHRSLLRRLREFLLSSQMGVRVLSSTLSCPRSASTSGPRNSS